MLKIRELLKTFRPFKLINQIFTLVEKFRDYLSSSHPKLVRFTVLCDSVRWLSFVILIICSILYVNVPFNALYYVLAVLVCVLMLSTYCSMLHPLVEKFAITCQSLRRQFFMFFILAIASLLIYTMLSDLGFGLIEINYTGQRRLELYYAYYIFSIILGILWLGYSLIVDYRTSILSNGTLVTITTIVTVLFNLVMIGKTLTWWSETLQIFFNSVMIPQVIICTVTSLAVQYKEYWRTEYYLPRKDLAQQRWLNQYFGEDAC